MDDRLRRAEDIDERALTADLIDYLDTDSATSCWGATPQLLKEQGIFLSTLVTRAKHEAKNGADIGIIIHRTILQQEYQSNARYASLVQCKKLGFDGRISDFFHETPGDKASPGRKQSSMMLEITPSSFYMIFVAPSQLPHYSVFEPISFVGPFKGCSSPVGNMGLFEYHSHLGTLMSKSDQAATTGVLIVPALAVAAQQNKGKGISIDTLLPNCMPLWYWFGQLLVGGFIGDQRSEVIDIASRTDVPDAFAVDYSIEFQFGTG
jgi:hypothetical protein